MTNINNKKYDDSNGQLLLRWKMITGREISLSTNLLRALATLSSGRNRQWNNQNRLNP